MSQAKRALKKAQEKPLPKTLTLTRSQALSLVALNNDEQRLRKQAEDVNAAVAATIKARGEVLAEISKAHTVTVEAIEQNYRFDGSQLILPVS